jgi:photosystem II stability/assembly factor-like uncharacterized protein
MGTKPCSVASLYFLLMTACLTITPLVLPAVTLAQVGWHAETLPALEEGVSYGLSDVKAVSTTEAWVSGGLSTGEAFVLKTTNGATWNLMFRKGDDANVWNRFGAFNRLSVVDSNHAWAGGAFGLTAYTVNGGSSWARETTPCGTDPGGVPAHVYGLKAVDATNVWMVGWNWGDEAGSVWHRPYTGLCNDWGWWPYRLEFQKGHANITAVDAADASNAWAAYYNNASLLHTTNGGSSWTESGSPTGGIISDVAAVDANTAWVVGAGGSIAKTVNGGASWVLQGSGVSGTLRTIAAVNANVAWAVGDGGAIVKTTDGGATWHPQISGTTETLTGVTAANVNTAWAVGDNQTLLHVADGGQNQVLAAPTVDSANPLGGPAAGGTTVDIYGTNFLPGAQVLFGGAPATGVTWFYPTFLRATTSAHAAGIVDVEVRNPDGQSAIRRSAFAYGGTQPILMQLDPWYATSGSGNTECYLYGAAFTASSVVQWNGVPLSTDFWGDGVLHTFIPWSQLTSPGTATVTVTDTGGASNALTFVIDYNLVSVSRPNPYPGTRTVTVPTVVGSSQAQFSGVSSDGWVRVDVASTAPPNTPPAGLVALPNRYFVVTAGNANFHYTSVSICLPYSDAEIAAAGLIESQLRLLRQPSGETAWTDVTTSLDTATNLICGTVANLGTLSSLFAIAGPAARPDAVGAFRPSDGTFYLDYNGNGQWDGCGTDRCLQIGMNGDVPLVGDWNGSGTAKVGAFRPSDGTFYLDYNGNGTWDGCATDRCLQIGMNGDIPLVGDWNGSGSSKVGAFRPSDGTFYLDHNGSGTWEGCGTDRCLSIGTAEDKPLVGKW